MPTIERLVLQDFRRFRQRLDLRLTPDLNVLVGDNEAGKSTVLLAIDLVLTASRLRVENLGIETLLPIQAVDEFMAGDRSIDKLPHLHAELYLSESGNPEFNGRCNLRRESCDGIKLECHVLESSTPAVRDMLRDLDAPFPYEYYACTFTTFSGAPYFGFRKHVRHLLVDSSRIDSEHAAREYTKALFATHTDDGERSRLESEYRRSKAKFQSEKLAPINSRAAGYDFAVRTTTRANLETDLVIREQGAPLELRGKGRQCQVKTAFALQRGTSRTPLHVLLLEEPENHLSHGGTRQLIATLNHSTDRQVIVATHSSFLCTRLDLRKARMLSAGSAVVASFAELTDDTAAFFMKAPDNNVLELALSRRVILVEGDAEFILIEALYSKHSGGRTLQEDGVHVISVGGTSFRRYLELAKLLHVRTAVIRDNDKDFQRNCVDNYDEFAATSHIRVFADRDNERSTFEICLFQDNREHCEKYLSSPRRKQSTLEYMLSNKTDAAFRLLRSAGDALVAPQYIREAIAWISA